MKYTTAIEHIRKTLDAHAPQRLKINGFKPAGILMPFFNKEDQAHLLFTVRTDTVEHHKGQISFPGGAREPRDGSLRDTAIRETEEEVGIPLSHIDVIGRVDDFPTVSSFLVTPYVATIPYPYPFQINHAEVAEILEVPLSLFLSDAHFEVRERTYNGKVYPIYYYHYRDSVIWGVTGFIINRFIEQVFDYNPAPRSIHSDPQNEDYLRENIVRRAQKPPQ